jgi:hypothetical protein
VLESWMKGQFADDWGTQGNPWPITPENLDRGPLDHCLSEGTAWETGPGVLSNADRYSEAFRLKPGLALGALRAGLPNWQADLAECAILWPAQTTMLNGSTFGGDWRDRGFVVRKQNELFLDAACGAPLPKKGDLAAVMSAPHAAVRNIVFIGGGGLGDGVVVVMTEHGPVIINPGDPVYAEVRRRLRRIDSDSAKVRKLAKRHPRKTKPHAQRA